MPIDGLEIVHRCLAVYSVVIIVVGGIGNIMTCLICVRKRLRSITTFVFLAFMAITDTFALIDWNLEHFLETFYDMVSTLTDLGWCKVATFLQFFSLQSSAWLLVAMTIDRYLSIRVKAWRTIYFNPKKAVIVTLVIFAVLFAINFHLLVVNGYIEFQNDTQIVHCYESRYYPLYPMWERVHVFLYSIIPFTFLLTFNSLLLRESVCKNRIKTNSRDDKKLKITFNIVTITISFILMTMPSAVVGAYFFPQLFETISGQIIIFFCDALSFSYHALNFIVFLLFNEQFKMEIRTILSFNKRIIPQGTGL